MNKKQRQTLNRILEKPERSDIPWPNIESLFIALGAEISEGRGSRVRVALRMLKPFLIDLTLIELQKRVL